MKNQPSLQTQSVQSKDNERLCSPSPNVYENTVLIAKRAKQVLSRVRASFSSKLEELEDFEGYIETSRNSRKQKLLSKKYEKMPKPVAIAIKDAFEGNLMYSYPDKDSGLLG